ncbi:lysozyme inhibitor LprI family protein [Stakelama pacifica]|uniref:Uncharacterized protein YecT (DUF1311 family) n=1 Tax=Stakelama pacifica TaxID=517720 RepID=A0A4R6FJB0_9SPHN|nr:lysozyme inhibitor LprI family protein [Stakelama pacifica]TDN80614.1 uncharacterized protein YecT (DUF1311 family) [Stakelama pacifica]GGO97643.1 hypothetical protein GCM10011329_27000 [Stakelama pacifica]
MLILAMMALAAQSAPACDDAKTQADMSRCSVQAYQAADATLNAQWKTTYAFMKARDASAPADDARPGYAPALLESQRDWLKYRDSQCRVEGYVARGGSMEPMLVSGCKAELTRERIKQLRDLQQTMTM